MTRHDIPLSIKDNIIDHICSGHHKLAVSHLKQFTGWAYQDTVDAVADLKESIVVITGGC